MMRNFAMFILVFVLLYLAFHQAYLDPSNGVPEFSDIFTFSYELTVGSLEVVSCIFKGPDAFLTRFSVWRSNVFGDVRIIEYIDNFTDQMPVLRDLKSFAESVITPLKDVFSDIAEWVREKISKE